MVSSLFNVWEENILSLAEGMHEKMMKRNFNTSTALRSLRIWLTLFRSRLFSCCRTPHLAGTREGRVRSSAGTNDPFPREKKPLKELNISFCLWTRAFFSARFTDRWF